MPLPATGLWCCRVQTLASVNKSIVGGFAKLDVRLEEAGVLPALEAPQHPDEVTDDDGQLTDDVNDVRHRLVKHLYSLPSCLLIACFAWKYSLLQCPCQRAL